MRLSEVEVTVHILQNPTNTYKWWRQKEDADLFVLPVFCLRCGHNPGCTRYRSDKLKLILSYMKVKVEKKENSHFPIAVQTYMWSGYFDSRLNEEQHLGWRDLLFALNKQPFDGLGVSPAVLKAVANDAYRQLRFCWVWFVLGFLDSIYKDLTYFLGQFWAHIKSAVITEEGQQGAPVPDLYSIHFKLIVSPFAIELNTFFMHVFQKIEVSINVIKKIIFFY